MISYAALVGLAKSSGRSARNSSYRASRCDRRWARACPSGVTRPPATAASSLVSLTAVTSPHTDGPCPVSRRVPLAGGSRPQWRAQAVRRPVLRSGWRGDGVTRRSPCGWTKRTSGRGSGRPERDVDSAAGTTHQPSTYGLGRTRGSPFGFAYTRTDGRLAQGENLSVMRDQRRTKTLRLARVDPSCLLAAGRSRHDQ